MSNIQGLQLPDGVDRLSLPQKALILGGLGVAGWYVLPVLLALMVNLVMVLAIGIPLAFVAYNYKAFWYLFAWLGDKTTSWIIGLDVLGAMDNYLLWVKKQYNILLASKGELEAQVESLQTEIGTYEKSFSDNKKRLQQAEANNNSAQISIYSNNLMMDKDFIEQLTPILDEGKKHVQYLDELVETFDVKQQQLAYTVKTQKAKYKSLKSMSKGLRAASSVQRGVDGNDMWRRTQEQLVNQMNKFTADIKTFETVLKPAIEQNRFDKQLRETEGRKLLEEFKNNDFQKLAA